MIDMDEVIVKPRFTDFLVEFLGEADFSKLNSFFRQDLIKGKEEEFKKIYQFKNLYKYDNGSFVEPLKNCVEVIKQLTKKYEVFVATHYVWKEDVINSEANKQNKLEYLKHFFPFINPNNFIFCHDKTQFKFDIGIDDNLKFLNSCSQKFLFTEFRNEHLTNQELALNKVTRVNNWLEVKEKLL